MDDGKVQEAINVSLLFVVVAAIAVLVQGKMSSLQSRGNPLYPMPIILLRGSTKHAPVGEFGSLDLFADSAATAKK